MKLIIDIPEYLYEAILEFSNVSGLRVSQLENAVLHGTPIDSATNGDIMNTMFDIVEDKHQDKGTINLYFFDLDIAIVVSLDWWNAPYQKSGKKKGDSNV